MAKEESFGVAFEMFKSEFNYEVLWQVFSKTNAKNLCQIAELHNDTVLLVEDRISQHLVGLVLDKLESFCYFGHPYTYQPYSYGQMLLFPFFSLFYNNSL